MIIIHAVQKLLNTGKLKPALFVSQPSAGQELHSWYAKLLSTGFPGKLIVMYVHEPSLLTVLTKGKTINATISQFNERLPRLMQRINFKPAFIETEMEMVKEGYVVSKTNSKSMLASMNVLTFNMEFNCRGFPTYESINLDYIEDIYTDWITMDRQSKKYRTIMDYWKERNVVVL
ncbi:MAG TPA: hypothetical protein VFW07_00340 [Parafilimonas sp.]|nr:hypothetical protein [Parafilimonas sp.]